MASITVYPDAGTGATTVDGSVNRYNANETWATIIAGAGTATSASGNGINGIGMESTTTSNQWKGNYRFIFTFDTSAIGSGNTINSATLGVRGWNKHDSFSPTISPDVNIYGSTPASNNALVNADYGQVGSTAMATAISYASWGFGAGKNVFTLNASGLSNISTTSISKFGARNANYDVAASAPTWTSAVVADLQFYTADNAGTTDDPVLTVNYSPPNTLKGSSLLMMGVG